MENQLSLARKKLAHILALGRPGVIRINVWGSNGSRRQKTIPGSLPSPATLKALAKQSAEVGLEVARLERERGELLPRLAPRIAQKAPSTRPDRLARTPRTGRWGFGLTPTYQGRRSPRAEEKELSAEWTASTLEEIALPCLKEESREETKHYSLGFAAKRTKGKQKRTRKAWKHEVKAWAEEEMALEASRKKREGEAALCLK